jgi:hypothetical protein
MAPALTTAVLPGTRTIQLTEPILPGTPISIGNPGLHEHTRVESCAGSTGPYTVTLVYGGILRHAHLAGSPVTVIPDRVRA